ncbi:unnamed protein product, partial [Brassica oleracea var. botrytis]
MKERVNIYSLVDPLCFLDSLEYDTLTHGYTEWFIPNYKRVVVSVLVSCVQSNKYNQPQLVEAVEFDTAERESLSPTIV